MITALVKIELKLHFCMYLPMFTKKFCYFCFIDEIGLCDSCLVDIETCLNCIVYGNGSLCLNCEIQGDEGISMHPNVTDINDWIRRNDEYFRIHTQE